MRRRELHIEGRASSTCLRVEDDGDEYETSEECNVFGIAAGISKSETAICFFLSRSTAVVVSKSRSINPPTLFSQTLTIQVYGRKHPKPQSINPSNLTV